MGFMPYKDIEKRRRTQEAFRIRNKLKVLEYLEGHPCIDCGNSNPIVLEFDHRIPSEKSFAVGRAVNGSHRSWKLIKSEIDKCDVRCANCHKIRTCEQQDWFKGLPV